jgi:hypothetical protein
MSSLVVMWVIIFVMGILAALVFVGVVVVDPIIQRRKKRHVRKLAEEYESKRAKQRPNPEFRVDGPYIQAIAINNHAKEHLQLIWLKTKAASPDEALCDALRLYAEIVSVYRHGNRLTLLRSPEEGPSLHFNYPPLDKIKKADS